MPAQQRAASPRRVRQPTANRPAPTPSQKQGPAGTVIEAAVGHDFGDVHVHAPVRLSLQPKLAVGTADGVHEQHADQVADRIMRTSTPSAGPPLPVNSSAVDQRPAPPVVHDVLASAGQPLDAATRAFMEPRFGHDFSRVRLHADTPAHQSARAVDARAFTVGQHIVFAEGRLVPGTVDGRRLLAHELTHVLQQGNRPELAVVARQPDPKRAAPNFDELARALAKKLQANKRSDVVRELQALQPADLTALEAAAWRVLQPPDAEQLRRVILFVGVPAPTNQSVVSITPRTGVEVTKAGFKVGAGAVTVHTGLTVDAGIAGKSDSAYALKYTGTDASEMRWLQFAWREVVPEYAVRGGKPTRVPARRKLEHSGQIYHLTTDPVKPQWNTDTGTSRSPFYEQDTTVNRSANELTLVDYPSPMATLVGELFGDPTRTPSRVVSRFHAATYLVKGMEILYRADVELTWEFTSARNSTLKSSAAGKLTKQLEGAHRTRLVIQFPNFAYLPGPVVDAPEREQPFDIVRDIAPTGSLTEAEWADPKRSIQEKFADIAQLADAYNLIDSVTGTTPLSITMTGKIPGATLKPGLNFTSELRTHFPDAPAGETGFLDAKGAYHNPKLPVERTGPLPKVVIILGPNAFTRTKAHGLATLRHEMEHARHEQLALGWLARWRDEQPVASFPDWLANQVKAKKLGALDAAVIGSFTGGTTVATEVLAWTEGLVTSLPFIPAVDVSLIEIDAKYPAAIKGLQGAGKNFTLLSSSKELTQAALDRIRDVCCRVLTQLQRDRLVAWIDLLLDPASRKMPDLSLKLTIANFGPSRDFLTRVRDIARKPGARCNP
jgi:hypothetical protein